MYKCRGGGRKEQRGKVLERGLTGDGFVETSTSYMTKQVSIPVQNNLLIPDRGSLLAKPVRRSPAAAVEVRRCK